MNNSYEMPAILQDFLNYLETIKGKSPNTIKVYFYDLRVFFRFIKIHKLKISLRDTTFDKIKISDINIDHIRAITLSDLYSFMSFISKERFNTARSRARKVASLKSFFNYLANKAKLLDINPASELESPKIFKPLPRYLSVAESKSLLSSINNSENCQRDLAILTLFLNCGMRLSELVNINMSNIKSNIITIIGKGNKERSIHLNNACIEAITNYIKVRPVNGVKDKDALFLSKQKKKNSQNHSAKHRKKIYLTGRLRSQKIFNSQIASYCCNFNV